MTFSFGIQVSKVKFYEPAFDQFKNAPRGEIGVNLEKKIGRPIVIAAKRQVGKDTNKLRDSIYLIHERVGMYQQIRIGSDDNIALIHHEGARPHEIRARQAQMLRFSSKGRMVYARSVQHPGTKPNRYLSDNLYLAYA